MEKGKSCPRVVTDVGTVPDIHTLKCIFAHRNSWSIIPEAINRRHYYYVNLIILTSNEPSTLHTSVT